MKCISLWQPWASAIAAGVKRCETRHWPTHYMGPVAIHAAKRWTRHELDFWREHVEWRGKEATAALFAAAGIEHWQQLPLGAIVATAVITSCRSTEELRGGGIIMSPLSLEWGDFSPGRYGWMLDQIQRLDHPIPYVGRQGFFEWSPVSPPAPCEPSGT